MSDGGLDGEVLREEVNKNPFANAKGFLFYIFLPSYLLILRVSVSKSSRQLRLMA